MYSIVLIGKIGLDVPGTEVLLGELIYMLVERLHINFGIVYRIAFFNFQDFKWLIVEIKEGDMVFFSVVGSVVGSEELFLGSGGTC